MKNLLTILIAVVASVTAVKFTQSDTAVAEKKETAYERVMRTGTLRCGYAVLPPALAVDPNTGEISGLDYEIIHALARKMDLEVKWVQETGFGTSPVGLSGGKFDMFCTGNWIDSRKAKRVYATDPYYYNPVFAMVRADDNRFNDDLNLINNPEIVISGIDNDPTLYIAEEDYPNAQTHIMPDIVSFGEAAETLLTRKADVLFMPYWSGTDYIEKHPGKIKFILDKPVRYYPVGYELPQDDELKYMFDVAMREFIASGEAKALLEKHYGQAGYSYQHIFKPYEVK